MMNDINAEFKIVLAINIPLKILFEINVADIGNYGQAVFLTRTYLYLIIVITVYKGSIRKKFIVENVIPS